MTRILPFIAVFGFIFGACTKDASLADNDGMLDQGMDTVSNVDGGCGSEPIPWWCTEADASMQTDVDDASTVNDAFTEKPDAGDKGDGKQFNGWIGDRETVTYTRYADEALVCELTYPLLNVRDVDACDACGFALEATLGEVMAVTNDGSCDEQAGREGDVVGFGHGTSELSQGVNELWIYKGAQWVLAVGSYSIFAEDAWTYYWLDLGDDPGSTQPQGMVCPQDFDPSEPCAPEEKCLLNGTWYYCDGGAWMQF
ncbi:MAG: hypothetical protein VYA30_14880 [Myxococcota bacterium]|nr:hypothetical protein [Myxococcota bacterium]